MLSELREAYSHAAQVIEAHGIIPCGEAMIKATEIGIKVHRDTAHASLGAGRYLLALCWYKALTGRDISKNTFNNFDLPVTEFERNAVINAVNASFI